MGDSRELLRTHQRTVYVICFQVLRRAHDAEDAAQDALLEISRGLESLREPRALKRWICRVALHTSLDHLRRRTRRSRHEEKKAAMTAPTPDPARDAVHTALSELDDDDRCLLVERYFERATLEEIGSREGISAAAVGKRVETAKDRLKKRLIQAGFASLAVSVDSMLEAAPPAPTAAHFLPTFGYSTTAWVGASIIGLKTTLIVVLLLGIAGGGVAWHLQRPSIPQHVFPSSGDDAALDGTCLDSGLQTEATDPRGNAKQCGIELRSRLDRFRVWYVERFKPNDIQGATFSLFDHDERLDQIRSQVDGVRGLILGAPTVFLEWIAVDENRCCVIDLFEATLAFVPRSEDEPPPRQRFQDFPAVLTDELGRQLQSGPDGICRAILKLALSLADAPPSWRAAYLELIATHADEEIRSAAVEVLLFSSSPSRKEIQALVEIAASATDMGYPNLLLEVCRLGTPVAQEVLLTALKSGGIPDPKGQWASCIAQWTIMFHPDVGESFQRPASELLLAAATRPQLEYDCSQLILAALRLKAEFARPILMAATSAGPTEKVRLAATRILHEVQPEEGNWRAHERLWHQLMRKRN